MNNVIPLEGSVYLSPVDWVAHVDHEIGGADQRWGRLLFKAHAPGQSPTSHWAHTIWQKPLMVNIESIGTAAQFLRSQGKLWAPFAQGHYKRMEFIQAKLPHLNLKPRSFPFDALLGTRGSSAGLGGWTLLEENLLLASAHTTSPFPNGELTFGENHIDPPSTAYLKLWEALTHLGQRPSEESICLDAGCAPGGWTWVLAQLGATVYAIDKGPLEKGLDKNPRIHYTKGDAFALRAKDLPPLDWFFSDVICYPSKLYEWIEGWVEESPQTTFVVTIKMQGDPDWKVLNAMASMPGCFVRHLRYNKHEVTWFRPGFKP